MSVLNVKKTSRIYLERLSLIEARALLSLANLGAADTEAWSEAEDTTYGWTGHMPRAGGRAIDKVRQYVLALEARDGKGR